MNNVITFLTLPHHTFDGESEGEDEDGELVMNSDDEGVDEPHTSKLGDEEEEDADEGSEGEDSDHVIEEASEEVAGDRERRKRRKMTEVEGDG